MSFSSQIVPVPHGRHPRNCTIFQWLVHKHSIDEFHMQVYIAIMQAASATVSMREAQSFGLFFILFSFLALAGGSVGM